MAHVHVHQESAQMVLNYAAKRTIRIFEEHASSSPSAEKGAATLSSSGTIFINFQ